MKAMLNLIMISLAGFLSPAENVQSHRLFHIERSKGPSIVCYDVVLQNGKLRADDPIDVYWMHPESGNWREELNWIERWKGYGIDVIKQYGTDSIDVVMRANKKPIRITMRENRWVALAWVDKKVSELTNIYVKTDESGLIPTVIFVKLQGKVRTSGAVVTETVTP